MSGLDKVVGRPARCLPGVALSWLLVAASSAGAQPVALGSAESYAMLARTTVSNTGASAVAGDVGVSLRGTVSGFQPGTVDEGSGIHEADAVAVQPLLDAAAAFEALSGSSFARRTSPPAKLSAASCRRGGCTCFDGDAPLSVSLTLVGAGPWSFLNGGRLTIDADAQVVAARNRLDRARGLRSSGVWVTRAPRSVPRRPSSGTCCRGTTSLWARAPASTNLRRGPR